jgi:hypothetical protein
MSVTRDDEPRQLTMRPLSKREIDDRIQRLISEVTAHEGGTCGTTRQPRWIAAGELVRRMQRFLSHN